MLSKEGCPEGGVVPVPAISFEKRSMFLENFQLDLDPADGAVESIALDAGNLNYVGFSLPPNMPANATDAQARRKGDTQLFL